MNLGGIPTQVTPVSTAMYGTTSTFSWAHTVPNFMPWVTKAGAEVLEPIVHFTAPPDPCTSQTATSWELLNNLGPNKSNVISHLKRKSELDVLETAPQKICITEEKMAARFKEMHISNRYSVPVDNCPSFRPCNSTAEKSITNLNQLDYILKGSETDPHSPSKSLVLAPELKKLVEPEKIFASTFLSKVERPTMALVLWQGNGLMGTSESIENAQAGEKASQMNTFVPQSLSVACTHTLLSNLYSNEVKSQHTFDEEMDS